MHRRDTDPEFDGEWIDLALFESLYRLIEWQVIFYDQLGTTPERNGNQLAVAPAAVINTYRTKDDVWLTVTSGTPRSVRNVAALVGVEPERVATVELQRANAALLDERLGAWIAERSADECLARMVELEVTASQIFSVEDIVKDPTYAELGDVITVEDPELGPVRMQGVIPRMTNHPGTVWRTGPTLGQDNRAVYQGFLGMDDDAYDALVAGGVIAPPAEPAPTDSPAIATAD